MIDPAITYPSRLAFAYRDGELQRFRQLSGRTINRIVPWHSFWLALGLSVFVIGLVVLGAQQAGLVTAANVRAVLFTAYVAFYSGAGLLIALFLQRSRKVMQASAEITGRGDFPWEIELTETGLRCKTALFETQTVWSAVRLIEVRADCVLIWMIQLQALAIPARVFTDDAERSAFIAAVRMHMEPASKEP
jgi:hypothetical protein